MNKLRCGECEIDLHGRDVYFDGVLCCRKCNNPVVGGKARRRRSAPPGKPSVPLPSSVKLSRQADPSGMVTLVLTVPWRIQRPEAALRLLAWILVVIVVLGGIELGVPLAGYALGALVLLTIGAVKLINHTRISVQPDSIRMTHGPIPWGSTRLATHELEQLYVGRRPIAQKEFDYDVRALLDDGRHIVFFRGLLDPSVAFYLEQCIEEHLSIKDRLVRGEYVVPSPPPPTELSPYVDSGDPGRDSAG